MAGAVTSESTLVAGVLGGMGPDATVDFMSRVLALTPAESDQEHVRMIVNHNPQVPDRQIAGDAQKQAVEQALADMAAGLEKAGADFLVMPCNTAHGFLAAATERVGIPFLNIVSETVAAVRLEDPEIERVGLLATDGCVNAKLYQDAIHDAGMSVLMPSSGEQALVMQLVYKIKSGDQSSDIAHEMLHRANSLIQQGADVIVAGCTEVPLVIPAERLTVPFISSTQVLAQRTVDICLGESALPEI